MIMPSMTAAAESRTRNPALDQTQMGGPNESALAWEKVESLEKQLNGPLPAEDRPRLLAEARERRAALEKADEEMAANRIYELRQALLGTEDDRVILERRATTAIPAHVVQEARDQIAAYQLGQRTRAWNADAEGQTTSERRMTGNVARATPTARFPETPSESGETPAMFHLATEQKKENAVNTAAERRKMALRRAQEQAGKEALKGITAAEIDAALPEPTRTEDSGVRTRPQKTLRAPTRTSLP